MANQVFLVGIGGTGMRCLESFVHLCALGMFDETEVNILALDTDRDNGNFRRVRELIIDSYNKAKGVDKKHYPLKNTLFSAKINHYQFSPDYSKFNTFESLFNYRDAMYHERHKADVANLLLTGNVRTFDLKHGYRAQTHVGSLLMYHAIIDEVENNPRSELRSFIEKLTQTAGTSSSRVFIFGSVFGGTGASSIPVIPKALVKAASIVSPGNELSLNTYFGATLVTSYFSFKLPSDEIRKQQKVVASSDRFSLNSQVAMMFYEADETVKKTYQKFYLMGTENNNFQPSKLDKPITGGQEQENDSHYIELLAASAAFDFFNLPESQLKENKDNQKIDYLFRTRDLDEKLRFSDFVGIQNEEKFARNFGIMVALSFMVNVDIYDFYEQARSGKLIKDNIIGYEDIDNKEIEGLKKYFDLFHFSVDSEKVGDGWLRQLHRSAGGGDKFLFDSSLFSITSYSELKKFSFNKSIFPKGSNFENNQFKIGVFGLGGSIFDTFKGKFKSIGEPDLTNKCEKLTKRIFDTFAILYGFNV